MVNNWCKNIRNKEDVNMCGEIGIPGMVGIMKATEENFIDINEKINSDVIKVLTPCSLECFLLFNGANGTIEKYFFENPPQIKDVGIGCLWCGVSQYCGALEEVAEVLLYGIKDTKLEQLLALIWRIKSAK